MSKKLKSMNVINNKMISKKTGVIFLLMGLMLISLVSAGDYKFQNTSGTDLMIVHGDTGNLTISGNVSAGTGFFGYLGSLANRITGLFVQDFDISNELSIGSHNFSATDINISNGTDAGFYFDYESGRVGIGTDSPGYVLDIDGSARFSGTLYGGTYSGALNGGAYVLTSQDGFIGWAGRALMYSPSDGVIRLSNYAGTNFTRLNFGGTTSSFPALGRNGISLYVGLADGTNGGNFGIGTSTPVAQLDISNTTQGIIMNSTGGIGDSPIMNTTGTTNLTITSSGGSVIIRLG